jgi:hypothetical protein
MVIAGEGRILIAASNFDEPAYELPGTGHGLLTKALIDILQEGQERLSLPSTIDKVMTRVRAEAARIGVQQTPVSLGHVTGGLTLPVLQAGTHFLNAFPQAKGIRVSHDIADLAGFGIPQALVTEWASRFPSGLNDLQLAAVNEKRVLDGSSLVVVAPTSAGKTFIGELAAIRAVSEARKAVFLLPYKALVNEKFDQFTDLYGRYGELSRYPLHGGLFRSDGRVYARAFRPRTPHLRDVSQPRDS